MPRKDQGWITFQLPEAERQLLESYCKQTERGKTDILRELVRTLNSCQSLSAGSALAPATIRKQVMAPGRFEIHSMRVSARNVLPAEVKKVILGSINAEIVLEIAPDIDIVSVITRSSAEALELVPGKLTYAVVKSSDVMVAVDGFE
ncbi:MAG: molybdopterin-binding protein [Chamaesiphon sp.]|nr:molybdopterin-binding protein [Chamaesiphon sp.]